jgi:hypothetical protein
VGAPFCEILRELPSKGGLGPSKRGKKRGKKGFPPNVWYQRSLPSFLLVSVRKIPRKYQPIPYQNTELGYNSSLLAVWPVSVSYRHLPVDIRFGIFCTVRFGGSSILWKFAGTPFCKFSGNLFSLKRGAWSIKKGAEASLWGKKGVPAKCTISKRPDQVFLRYRLGKYRENTNRYQTKIPNRGTTLLISAFP